MLNNYKSLLGERGSMMVEALAMLGLITMVTPVLYKKAAERTTELQDINAASQLRTISKALDDFIKDNYVDLTTTGGAVQTITANDLKPYLPYGFNLTDSKLFSGYKMSVRRTIVDAGTPRQHASITGMVLAPVKGTLPAIRSAKIASMVGANGAVVKSNTAQGVQGAWSAKLGDYGMSAAGDGSLASSSLHAINASAGVGSDHVLFRDNSMGDVKYNTMSVNMYMGGNSIGSVYRLIADSSKGQVLITGNEAGQPAKKANLVVEGAGKIADLLEAGSANIASSLLLVNSSDKVKVNDKLTVTKNGLDVTGPSALKGDTTITGAATVNSGKLTANNGAEVKAGLTVSGGSAATGDGNTYSLAVKKSSGSDGSLLVENNARINNNLYVGGEFSANKIYGRTELGGGLISGTTYNFLATNSAVKINKNAFTVGSRLATSDAQALMTSGNYKLDLTASYGRLVNSSNKGFEITGSNANIDVPGTITARVSDASKLTINASSGTLLTGAAQITGSSTVGISGNAGKQQVNLKNNQVAITNTGGGYQQGVFVNTDNINLESRTSAKTNYLKLQNNILSASNNNIVIDDKKMVFADGAQTTGAYNSDGSFNNTVPDRGVIIRREGMINLGAAANASGKSGRSAMAAGDGDQNVKGYIKLDRVLANQAYKYPGTGDYSTGVSNNEKYDAYQVNPAYTSVMHDIKLTTRGGARLSDILPDFINKGIYVIDNTYKEPANNRSWENYKVSVSGGRIVVQNEPSSCGSDANCITTPWLGFVPTPQCPPGYSKVITINPIRWKMAEAYTIAMNPSGVTDIAQKFKSYFIVPRNPGKGRFELAASNGSGNHTHEVAQGMPLTFQTNTWLNTTISGVRAGSTASSSGNAGTIRNGDFLGWHAIMGFLYHGSDYKDYIQMAGGNPSSTNGKIVWNLFPVYNEEMTAIANVYCYFERRKMTTSPVWSWDSSIVDTKYDQLTNFRNGFNKDNSNSDYVKRLNDPSLKYNDPW